MAVSPPSKARRDPEKCRDPKSEEAPDEALDLEEYWVDPRLHARDDDEVPRAWRLAFNIEKWLEQLNHWREANRREARQKIGDDQLERQVPNLKLFEKLASEDDEPKSRHGGNDTSSRPPKEVVWLFVLVFPGETQEGCTGTKELNDWVIGYDRNASYIRERNAKIREIFGEEDNSGSGNWHDNFTVIRQNYKTSVIAAVKAQNEPDSSDDDMRKMFDTAMAKMDDEFADILLRYVNDADGDPQFGRNPRILARKLVNDHTFEMFYGQAALSDARTKAEVIYRASTDCQKAAGVARTEYELDTKAARNYDSRGRSFDFGAYQEFLHQARELRESIRNNNDGKVKVDDVPAVVFKKEGGEWIPNPHVIRDARKDKLGSDDDDEEERQQIEWIKSYIRVINTMDFLKDFLGGEEFPGTVKNHLAEGRSHRKHLGRPPNEDVDREAIENFIQRDLRGEYRPALGRASEYVFYAETANYGDRLILILDVRDLGVDVLTGFSRAVEKLLDAPEGQRLPLTLESTDSIVQKKRKLFQSVQDAFRDGLHDVQGKFSAGKVRIGRLRKAWGWEEKDFLRSSSGMGSPGFLLGGDEVFVAADPLYLVAISEILSKLCPPDKHNVRAAVALSRAHSTEQERGANAIAHNKAIQSADKTMGSLKHFERHDHRLRRRIARMDDAEDRRHCERKLNELGLFDLFRLVPPDEIGDPSKSRRKRRSEETPGHLRRVKTGSRVDPDRLEKDVVELEEKIKSGDCREN
jgi:hypothetical protein